MGEIRIVPNSKTKDNPAGKVIKTKSRAERRAAYNKQIGKKAEPVKK